MKKFNIYWDLVVIALVFAFLLNFLFAPAVMICAEKINPGPKDPLTFYAGTFLILAITLYKGIDFFTMKTTQVV